jgi:Uma2 family endonuclease
MARRARVRSLSGGHLAGRLSVYEYLAGPEQTQPQELVWGVLREPPSPFYRHQEVVVTALSLIRQYVRQHNLGHVCVSPMDVVLDEKKALMLLFDQPARAFVG